MIMVTDKISNLCSFLLKNKNTKEAFLLEDEVLSLFMLNKHFFLLQQVPCYV